DCGPLHAPPRRLKPFESVAPPHRMSLDGYYILSLAFSNPRMIMKSGEMGDGAAGFVSRRVPAHEGVHATAPADRASPAVKRRTGRLIHQLRDLGDGVPRGSY